MFRSILLISAVVLSTSGQILVQPVVSLFSRTSNHKFFKNQFLQPRLVHPQLAHPANVANSEWEHQLPPNLLKSTQFYGNARTAEHLAQASWLTDKESPVFSRKAEEIDRNQITKIFHNAGLQKRK